MDISEYRVEILKRNILASLGKCPQGLTVRESLALFPCRRQLMFKVLKSLLAGGQVQKVYGFRAAKDGAERLQTIFILAGTEGSEALLGCVGFKPPNMWKPVPSNRKTSSKLAR